MASCSQGEKCNGIVIYERDGPQNCELNFKEKMFQISNSFFIFTENKPKTIFSVHMTYLSQLPVKV